MPKLTRDGDVFLHLVVERRQQGATLREIGSETGISPEGIRQWLIRYYGATKMRILFNSAEVAKATGISIITVYNYQKLGIIKPVNQGVRHLYDNDAIKAISVLRHCQVCGENLTSNRIAYCSEKCYKISQHKAHERGQWRKLKKRMGKPITPSIALRVRGLVGRIQQ